MEMLKQRPKGHAKANKGPINIKLFQIYYDTYFSFYKRSNSSLTQMKGVDTIKKASQRPIKIFYDIYISC